MDHMRFDSMSSSNSDASDDGRDTISMSPINSASVGLRSPIFSPPNSPVQPEHDEDRFTLDDDSDGPELATPTAHRFSAFREPQTVNDRPGSLQRGLSARKPGSVGNTDRSLPLRNIDLTAPRMDEEPEEDESNTKRAPENPLSTSFAAHVDATRRTRPRKVLSIVLEPEESGVSPTHPSLAFRQLEPATIAAVLTESDPKQVMHPSKPESSRPYRKDELPTSRTANNTSREAPLSSRPSQRVLKTRHSFTAPTQASLAKQNEKLDYQGLKGRAGTISTPRTSPGTFGSNRGRASSRSSVEVQSSPKQLSQTPTTMDDIIEPVTVDTGGFQTDHHAQDSLISNVAGKNESSPEALMSRSPDEYDTSANSDLSIPQQHDFLYKHPLELEDSSDDDQKDAANKLPMWGGQASHDEELTDDELSESGSENYIGEIDTDDESFESDDRDSTGGYDMLSESSGAMEPTNDAENQTTESMTRSKLELLKEYLELKNAQRDLQGDIAQLKADLEEQINRVRDETANHEETRHDLRKAKDDLEGCITCITDATVAVNYVIESYREQSFVHDQVRSLFQGSGQTGQVAHLAQGLLNLVSQCELDKQRLEERNSELQVDLSNERAEMVSLRKLINAEPASTTPPNGLPKSRSEVWHNLWKSERERAYEVGRKYEALKARFDASNIYGLEKKNEHLRTELDKAKDNQKIAREQTKQYLASAQSWKEENKTLKHEHDKRREGFDNALNLKEKEMIELVKEYREKMSQEEFQSLEGVHEMNTSLKLQRDSARELLSTANGKIKNLEKAIEDVRQANERLQERNEQLQEATALGQFPLPPTRSGRHQSRTSSLSDYEDIRNGSFSIPQGFRPGRNSIEGRYIPRCHLPDASSQRRQILTDWKAKRDRDRQSDTDIHMVMEIVRAWQFKKVEEQEAAKTARTQRQSYVRSKVEEADEDRSERRSMLKQSGKRLYPPFAEQWSSTLKQTVWNRWEGEGWWTGRNGKDREKYSGAVEKLRSGQITTLA